MIELNLLPDVKMEYIKAQRSQRLVLSVSFIVSVAAISILVMLLLVDGVQRKHISDLTNDIKTNVSTLNGKPQINKILTVQNQLDQLTALHAQKPEVSRLFSYLNQVTPSSVAISSINVDFSTGQTMSITGTADSLSSINQYVDTLKFTTFTTNKDSTPQKAFKNVVLGSFSIGTQGVKGSGYSISMNYDKAIFDNTLDVKLKVPSQVTTRSETDKPSDLFQSSSSSNSSGAR